MGSAETTSHAAPAIRPEFRASARAASSIRGPRAVFTRNAENFIFSIEFLEIRPWVSGVRGQWRVMTSDCSRISSMDAHWKGKEVLAEREREFAKIFILKAAPSSAVRWPMRPKPITPRVLPASSVKFGLFQKQKSSLVCHAPVWAKILC